MTCGRTASRSGRAASAASRSRRSAQRRCRRGRRPAAVGASRSPSQVEVRREGRRVCRAASSRSARDLGPAAAAGHRRQALRCSWARARAACRSAGGGPGRSSERAWRRSRQRANQPSSMPCACAVVLAGRWRRRGRRAGCRRPRGGTPRGCRGPAPSSRARCPSRPRASACGSLDLGEDVAHELLRAVRRSPPVLSRLVMSSARGRLVRGGDAGAEPRVVAALGRPGAEATRPRSARGRARGRRSRDSAGSALAAEPDAGGRRRGPVGQLGDGLLRLVGARPPTARGRSCRASAWSVEAGAPVDERPLDLGWCRGRAASLAALEGRAELLAPAGGLLVAPS